MTDSASTLYIADCMLDGCEQINPTREIAFKLQQAMQEGIDCGDFVAADCPLLHTFSKGSYARSIFIPKGSRLVGKTHRHRHLLIMSFGDVSMTTDEGFVRLQGFNVLDSQAGIKRCVYANENTVITTVHLTDETDLAKIEDDVIIPDTDLLESSQKIGEIS
jgi:hypothetical protein